VESVLNRYRRQDRRLKIGAIIVLLMLIGMVVAPSFLGGPSEQQFNPDIALFEPQRPDGERYLRSAELRLQDRRAELQQEGS
jgi:hypothetical protein